MARVLRYKQHFVRVSMQIPAASLERENNRGAFRVNRVERLRIREHHRYQSGCIRWSPRSATRRDATRRGRLRASRARARMIVHYGGIACPRRRMCVRARARACVRACELGTLGAGSGAILLSATPGTPIRYVSRTLKPAAPRMPRVMPLDED